MENQNPWLPLQPANEEAGMFIERVKRVEKEVKKMLKNISGYQKRFSSLQPLRKRGEVLKKADENEVKQKR
ncbi:hypothetical protein [Mucilaginibacter jinjuensis]|uniref:Uncharacterized protein n=1 Tax=Mucilaginibacter jinjuensis TaxID=1176721 RepID=A0ABY7T5K4_9SPHI|nr:hypothetical protein [Mucilaginibacter jinjuensis]WCT11606.1 hypothetical protein PQO05_22995 [Mucilaginibacter jinjuensis]